MCLRWTNDFFTGEDKGILSPDIEFIVLSSRIYFY